MRGIVAGVGVATFIGYPAFFAFWGLVVSLVFFLVSLTGAIVMPFAFMTPVWIGALIGLGVWLAIAFVVFLVAKIGD